jgi:hypothetical protein
MMRQFDPQRQERASIVFDNMAWADMDDSIYDVEAEKQEMRWRPFLPEPEPAFKLNPNDPEPVPRRCCGILVSSAPGSGFLLVSSVVERRVTWPAATTSAPTSWR